MASVAAMSVRRAHAMAALDKAKDRLSRASGVELDVAAPKPKDPDMARIVFVEETAKLLDQVSAGIENQHHVPDADLKKKPKK